MLYEGKELVICTKHKKEEVMYKLLNDRLGAKIIVDNTFDTDKFGTFSREIKRKKSQIETARSKIKKYLKKSKASILVVSEGVFGSHSDALIPWNTELVMLYDKNQKMEVYGYYESAETNFDHSLVNSYEEVLDFAKSVGFPQHHLIIRPDDSYSKKILKGIDSYEKLEKAYNDCLIKSKKGIVFIETDMRAYANPTRMKNIEKATSNLIDNLLSFCPCCNEPGFIVSEVIYGLPCSSCGLPSDFPLEYVHKCWKCGYKENRSNSKQDKVNPMYCHYCNP